MKSFDESLKINIIWVCSNDGEFSTWDVNIGGKLRKIHVNDFELWLVRKDLILMTHLFDILLSCFWVLAWTHYSLINPSDINYFRIQISKEKAYDGTYDDLTLSVFSNIPGWSK